MNIVRRDALKALGAAAIAASGAPLPRGNAAAAETRAPIEKGAELKLLRWKRYVQGDEDLWMANTAKFTERTGVKVQVESIVGEELRAKGAMVASVGAGPDIVVGSPEMPHQYADKCVDLTEVAGYLGQKYGGWYDVCQRSCMLNGRWIALSIAVVSFCVVYRQSMVKAAGFSDIPRDLTGFLKLCEALKAKGTPVGLPYGVPESVKPEEEAAYLHPFNQHEARAWVGLGAVAYRLFDIEWELLPAREVGTYGFPGGNALVDVPPGYRQVPHFDSEHHARRYHALANQLQEEALAWFTMERLEDIAAKFAEAETKGRAMRPTKYPAPREMARLSPKHPGRNDLCICGSMRKWKHCCGAQLET